MVFLDHQKPPFTTVVEQFQQAILDAFRGEEQQVCVKGERLMPRRLKSVPISDVTADDEYLEDNGYCFSCIYIQLNIFGLGFMQISPKLFIISSSKLTNAVFGMELRYECCNFKIKHPEGPQREYHPSNSMESD